eukprot:s2733_g8.t1
MFVWWHCERCADLCLLVATPSEAAYRVLFEALEKKVKIQETGRVSMSGGSLKFLGHENALRVLRFLVNHMKCSQVFPSPGLEQNIGLEVYSDAGYAPMQATQRRSITGCVIVFRRVVLKCFSRHQSSVTLSSCEAELVALQSAVQEAIGLLKSLSFVLRRIQVFPPAWSEDDALDFICPILMRTDIETPVAPVASASRVDEPETPVLENQEKEKAVKPKVKPMPRPRKTIVKRAAAKGKSEKPATAEKQSASSVKPKPAVKKMPRRIAVKQEKAESVRGRKAICFFCETETCCEEDATPHCGEAGES